MSNKQKGYVKIGVLTVTLFNAILVMLGYNPLPFSDDLLYEIFSGLIVFLVPLYTSIKNTDVTDEGVAGTAVTKELKGKSLNAEEAKALSKVKTQK